uniref:cytochrome b n=1 Tax=Ceratozetella imperatoria TaxID=3127034 RepID=UPI00315C7F19
MKKTELKMNPILKMVKSSLLDLPSPSSISFLWNMGFLLGMALTLQIVTGLILSMMYTAQTESAFKIMMMIMRDYNTGWVTRMVHTNGASLFFILLYIHTARGIYFSSPANKMKVWMSGVIILLMVMATAFLGYVLPWGQMSFWGATVITGVLSAIPLIGNDLVTWVWGGPSVSQPTLNRFFSLHFLLPMVIAILVLIHLIMLHEKGSSNPSTTHTSMDKVKFNPIFTIKDSLPMVGLALTMVIMCSNIPNILGDVENFNPANPMVAPVHIQPEWYFLFAYVILRSIPSKLGGVVALAASMLILMVMVNKKSKSSKFSITKKMKFWFLISVIFILTWIGAKTVESPFEGIGQIYTILYFALIIMF